MAPDNFEEKNEGVEGEVNLDVVPGTPGEELEPADNPVPEEQIDPLDDEPADGETILEDETIPTDDLPVKDIYFVPETSPEVRPTALFYRGNKVIGEPRETVINGNLCVIFKAIDTMGGEQEFTVMKEEFMSEALVKKL